MAIPAFARKYEYSCTTCHAPAPRLNAFGEKFAARGFRLEDPAQEPVRSTATAGDPLLWLTNDFPVSARIDGFAIHQNDAYVKTDFQWPWAFKILSGGPLSDKISYYVDYVVEEGAENGLWDNGGLREAYLKFSRPFNLPVDLLVGQFQVADQIFRRELRLERNDYFIYNQRPLSYADLTYDRGLEVFSTLPGEIEMVLGLYNGNGLSEGFTAYGTVYDLDGKKTYSVRMARRFDSIRLGLFGYGGKENFSGAYRGKSIKIFGPDLSWEISPSLQLNLQYLDRRDDASNLGGNYTGDVCDTRGGFAELTWLPKGPEGRWAVSLLYNNIDIDYQDYSAKPENASVTANYLLARNIRLLAEAEYDFANMKGLYHPAKDQIKVSLGVSAAF